MRRIVQGIFYIFIVGLFLFPLSVHAQSITPTPIEPEIIDPNQPTYLPAIIQNENPPPGPIRKDPQVAGIAPWGFGFTFANEVAQKVFDVTGVSFPKKHTIKVPNVGPDGRQVEMAGVSLMSKPLQEACLKLITYEQKMTANHRNCFYDEDGGGDHTPQRNILGNISPGLNKLRGGVEMMNVTVGIGKLACEALNFYETLPDERVAPDNGLPCYTQTDELTYTGLFDQGSPEHEYEEGADPYQATANLFCSAGAIAKFLECKLENAQLPEDERKNCTLSCNKEAHTVYSTLWSGAEKMIDHLAIGEDGTKQGFAYSFLPQALSLTDKHGTNTEDHELSLANIFQGQTTSEKAAYYMLAQEKEHMKALNCMNTSKNNPNREGDCEYEINTNNAFAPNVAITSSEGVIQPPAAPSCQSIITEEHLTRNTSTALDSAMSEAAAWANIPLCALQGVAEIEGAREEIASNQCSPNQCSATGPFQITTGFRIQGSGTQCSKSTDCSQCGPGYCPNAVETLSQSSALTQKFGDNLNPCDTRVAAHMAASLLDGKAKYLGFTLQGNISDPKVQQAIMYAGDSYYGTTKALTRPGPWFGLSYGEYVLSRCVSGVTHKDHTFPSQSTP
jgi:hypothetical protein